MDTMIWMVFCLLAAIGLVQAGSWLWSLLIRPRAQNRGYYVLPMTNDPAGLEAQLRYGLTCRYWGGARESYLILLDNGLNEEGLNICHRMLEDTCGVFICGEEDLTATLRGLEGIQRENREKKV